MGKLIGAKVFNTEKCEFEEKSFSFSDKILSDCSDNEENIDGCYIIPGLIDIHTHGRCGHDIMDSSAKELEELSLDYAKTGVTTVFPTVMTAPLENIYTACANIKEANEKGARFVGIHVEGPYISEKKNGAHDIPYIRKPSEAELSDIIDKISPLKTHFTISPETCPDGLIETLSKKCTLGIGHTDTDEEGAKSAVDKGAKIFTHTFNAMTPMTHRAPGVVGAALTSDAYAEFICDGFHINKSVIAIAYRAKGGNKFVLITDSLPPAGLPDGAYEMNGIKFNLVNGHAQKENGTIVGSTVSMLESVKNLSEFANISFEEALICATKNPAEVMGLYGECGSLDEGKRADFVILDNEKNIKSVYIGGERII